jgi:cysteine synthase A
MGLKPLPTKEAILYAQRLAKEEGIISGISCGAAAAVAARLAQQPEHQGKTIVVILPDSERTVLEFHPVPRGI